MSLLQSRSQREALYNLAVMAAYVVVMTFVLRFLWNGTLVKHISVLKPVDSLVHTFLLALSLALFKL